MSAVTPRLDVRVKRAYTELPEKFALACYYSALFDPSQIDSIEKKLQSQWPADVELTRKVGLEKNKTSNVIDFSNKQVLAVL